MSQSKVESNPAGPDKPAEAPRQENIRDTIESIILAFILAFVFRAFIVEAFVIPTGSMAPSLYGMHGQHRCENCKYPFAYGIREDIILNPGSGKPEVFPGTLAKPFTLRCPNCTWSGEGNAHLNSQSDRVAAANSGDRILVLKWGYDIGGKWLGPKRWDVSVFKDPQNGEMNFIKRVLGLPGEVLEIINGDVYTAPEGTVPQDILKALAPPALTGRPRPHRLDDDQIKRLASVLRIARKTPVAQESLWMLHYEHDFKPIASDAGLAQIAPYDPPYWEGENDVARKAWDATTPIVRFTPVNSEEPCRLLLKGKPIADDYGYNNVYQDKAPTPNWVNVGDVQLRFVLFPGAGEGELVLNMAKESERFRATIRSSGEITLEMIDRADLWRRIGQPAQIEPLSPARPLEIEFENLDYRVALRIDGEEVVATTDADYAPDVAKLLKVAAPDGHYGASSIAIAAKGMPLELRHLAVYRDVYYRSPTLTESHSPRQGDDPGWGTVHNPIHLRFEPAEYFCCGDNSPQSKDSRLWVEVCELLRDRGNYQYGTVPGDQLIGRAFFVYWPNGLRFAEGTIGIIPNVGKMRIIR